MMTDARAALDYPGGKIIGPRAFRLAVARISPNG
jgi:hypothetical protein